MESNSLQATWVVARATELSSAVRAENIIAHNTQVQTKCLRFSLFSRIQARSTLGHSSSNRRVRRHRIAGMNRWFFPLFTFLTCYLFSTCEFLFLCYISARHLTYKLLKLKCGLCNLADMRVFGWCKCRQILSLKQPQRQLDPNNAKCTSSFKLCNEFG